MEKYHSGSGPGLIPKVELETAELLGDVGAGFRHPYVGILVETVQTVFDLAEFLHDELSAAVTRAHHLALEILVVPCLSSLRGVGLQVPPLDVS